MTGPGAVVPDLTRRGFLWGTVAATTATSARPAHAAPEGADSCAINGETAPLPSHDATALEVLRARGLTGCKLACGHGACGACTVAVDGVPHVTCILPASALKDRAVTTVEAIGSGGLHPVQRAFLAEDALQCGYCTPGFVVEAVAFHDRWRAENAGPPSEDDVHDALAGHLCRCGAYPAITRAVIAACRGAHDAADPVAPRYDARDKVTGAAKYTVDVQLPGLLQARVRRSPVAHGTVRSIDVGPALVLDGVKAAIPLVKVGQTIRHAGTALAAVAAVDEAAAAAGIAAVDVTIDPLPFVLDFDDALADGAPLVYATKQAYETERGNAAEGVIVGPKPDGNTRGPVPTNFFSKAGKARKVLADGGEAWTSAVQTHAQSHTALEPHATVAAWDEEGGLDLWVSTQSVSYLGEDLAAIRGLDPRKVRVHAVHVGGAFGAKVGLKQDTVIAVDLAAKARAPVRLVLTRAEELLLGGYRPAARVEVELAVRDGALAAVRAHGATNAGTAVGSNTGALIRLVYELDAKDVSDTDVLTHTPPGSAFRGPSGPGAYTALENAVDDVAGDLGEDPLTLRRRWDTNPVRQRLYDALAAAEPWVSRREPDAGRFRRGVGMGNGAWFVFHDRRARIQLSIGPHGVTVRSGCQDMGNGSKSVAAWEAARALGLDRSLVEVDFGHSGEIHGPLSAGSRTTASIGPAVTDACAQLVDEIALALGLRDARAVPGGLDHAGGHAPWSDLLSRMPPTAVVGRRPLDRGEYFIPFAMAGLRVVRALAVGTMAAEVEVDTLLGRVRVLRTWVGIGAGRVVVPPLARSQVEGAVVQGVSYALYELRRLDPGTGALLSRGLEDYRIAGISDIPEIAVHFDEGGHEDLHGGGTGLSELAAVLPMPAITNAVAHAIGRRPALPLGPQQVLA